MALSGDETRNNIGCDQRNDQHNCPREIYGDVAESRWPHNLAHDLEWWVSDSDDD